MIHEHIKAIARRSLATDRVLFGESKKHPLGFDGFNIDNSIDAALLQLNTSNYSTVTSLHMECASITRMLKETADIQVGTKIARLYKESKLTDAIKKVIAFISKAIKFIFVELPKKIYNKIKSLFTKKKRDVNVAKQTAESMEKNINAMKQNADAMSEAVKKAADKLAAQKTAEFEAWKVETLKELHDLDKGFEALSEGNAKEADELADKLIKKAKADKEANMRVVNDDELDASFDELERSKDKLNKTKKDALTSMHNRHVEAGKTISDSLKAINDNLSKAKASRERIETYKAESHGDSESLKRANIAGDMLDELLDGMGVSNLDGASNTENIYRDMELHDMAIDLLVRISKEKALVKKIKSIAFDNESFRLWMASIIGAGADHKHMNLYVVNAMLRLVPLPYVSSVVAKYIRDERDIEIFGNGLGEKDSFSPQSNAVIDLMGKQIKSLKSLADNLKKSEWVNFDILQFDSGWVERHHAMCSSDNDGWHIDPKVLYTLHSEDAIEKVTISDRMHLNKLMSTSHALLVDTERMDSAIEELKKITPATIASKMGVSEEEMTSDKFKEKLNQELNSVMSLINSAVKLKNGIVVGALKCVNSLIDAEDTLLGAIIINDDKFTAITIGQLSRYIAGDENMMKKVWNILKKA